MKKSAEMYAGCVAGAIQQDEYLEVIEQRGFTNILIHRTKTIQLPDEVLKEYLNEDQMAEFRNSGLGIFSITVTGVK